MSSINRARSSASAHAAAGVWAISGVPPPPRTRQHKPPFEAAERRRQSERIRGNAAGRAFGKCNLVLVDVADGDDARQDRAVAVKTVEKGVAHQPAGAARRQIEPR
jgi:hypothetical protein